MQEIEHVSVKMNADRVCDAIARIGYSPWAALMDITDNSVAANAKSVLIQIELVLEGSKTYASSNNVGSYTVLDNGIGMTNEEVANALTLGSEADYPPDSLSKYGMGLKSAGFSLGGRIVVLSQKNGVLTDVFYVDRGVIREKGDYVVCKVAVDLREDLQDKLNGFLGESDSGTIVVVEECGWTSQASAATTVRRLEGRLGVCYEGFISQHGLNIAIDVTGKPRLQIKPKDILFRSDARRGFDPDTYEGKLPCLVKDEEFRVTEDEDVPPVSLQVVIFPQNRMSSNPDFSKEERNRIKSYGVKRDNKGFFIYRNGRLICWGNDLDGVVSKDKIGFRARLDLKTAHDEHLHVDVSKQRLSIPDEVRNKIENLVRIPLREADDAFRVCKQSLLAEEGESFNEKNQELVEEDMDEPLDERSKREATKRKKELEKQTEIEQQIELDSQNTETGSSEDDGAGSSGDGDTEPEAEPPSVTEMPIFQKVRYSDKVNSMAVWASGLDPFDGSFVRINKNHPFYSTVLSNLTENGSERQAVEALLWSLAAAENRTIENMVKEDSAVIRRILQRFKKIVAGSLDNWCTANQDLFDG